jgi:hypothetical protein
MWRSRVAAQRRAAGRRSRQVSSVLGFSYLAFISSSKWEISCPLDQHHREPKWRSRCQTTAVLGTPEPADAQVPYIKW